MLVILTGASRGHLETWLFCSFIFRQIRAPEKVLCEADVPSVLVQNYDEGKTSGFTVCFALDLVGIQNISNKICISE